MDFRVITQPLIEPVSLEELKLHLEYDNTDRDTYFNSLISASRKAIETYLSRSLITQTLEQTFNYNEIPHCYIEPLYPPIQTINSITLYNKLNEASIWGVSNYSLFQDKILYTETVDISIDLREYYCFVVNYDAGYGDTASDVPHGVRQAILDCCQYMFECGCEDFPLKLKIQLDPYREIISL